MDQAPVTEQWRGPPTFHPLQRVAPISANFPSALLLSARRAFTLRLAKAKRFGNGAAPFLPSVG
jgi:hypothetical protein